MCIRDRLMPPKVTMRHSQTDRQIANSRVKTENSYRSSNKYNEYLVYNKMGLDSAPAKPKWFNVNHLPLLTTSTSTT